MRFDSLEQYSKNVALIEEDGTVYSYQNLLDYPEDLFSFIEENQLAILILENSFHSISTYVACLRNRVVPIILSSEYDISIIEKIVDKYKPRYIISTRHIELNHLDFKETFSDEYCYLLEAKQNRPGLNPMLGLLLTTSGSTGSSELVRLSRENLEVNANSIRSYLEMNSTSRAITTLPPSYSYGLSIINSHILVGGSIVLNKSAVNQRKFWQNCLNFNPTQLGGVPLTYELLSRDFEKLMELQSLGVLHQAGGRLEPKLASCLASLCIANKRNFFIMYGQTEATARISFIKNDEILAYPGSIGRAIPGGRLKINYFSDNDEWGELVYTGPNVSFGYARNLDDLKLGNVNNGELKTGDIATCDNNGLFYLKGRLKRVAKLNGIRINLSECENSLAEKGFEGLLYSDDIQLHFFHKDDLNTTQITDVLQLLTGIKRIKVKFRKIEAYPRTPNGKIDFAKLGEYATE